MTERPELERGWRPETYWPSLPSDEDLVGRVRGARRRELLREALAEQRGSWAYFRVREEPLAALRALLA